LQAIKVASEKTKIVNAVLNMLRQLLTAKGVPGNREALQRAWGGVWLERRRSWKNIPRGAAFRGSKKSLSRRAETSLCRHLQAAMDGNSHQRRGRWRIGTYRRGCRMAALIDRSAAR